MIETNVYRCKEGCQRMSAAKLEGHTCCAHGLVWTRVVGSRVDVRLPGENGPLMKEVRGELN